jgi:alpha-ketoglutarate-dependent taurine dioxygenase
MTDDLTPEEQARARAEQRRRLAEIFGDVIPEQTSDDSDDDQAGRRTEETAQEDWLKRQVPPHHG